MGIKLNGSTSGYVQIDAPAVAGSTQITLPATTGGSFVVSDSSGNVGIGTTSPAASLSITKQTTALSGSANAYGIYAYPTSSGATYVDALTNSSGNTTLSFRTYNNTTYYTTLLDSSGNLQVGGTTVANTVGYVNSRTNARAWVNFTGVTTTSITASYNVSSVTRNATGDYTINLTTALADANYIWHGYAERNTPYKAYNNDAFYEVSKSTSALNLKIVVVGSLSAEDTPRAFVTIFGN
jgi:hypothetical protein